MSQTLYTSPLNYSSSPQTTSAIMAFRSSAVLFLLSIPFPLLSVNLIPHFLLLPCSCIHLMDSSTASLLFWLGSAHGPCFQDGPESFTLVPHLCLPFSTPWLSCRVYKPFPELGFKVQGFWLLCHKAAYCAAWLIIFYMMHIKHFLFQNAMWKQNYLKNTFKLC